MIKKLTKYFAIATLLKNLISTKSDQAEGLTQIHPAKIPGRTVFIREKEYFIRESYIENTTPIIFLHSWGSDSLGSWFKILPFYRGKNSFVAIDMKNHGKSDSSWMRWDVDENADIVISILNQLGIKKCNLVGWSMGSAVALSVSRKKKDLINKMVLITPFSWLGGAVYKDKPLFKVFVAIVRIRERLFPNMNPKSKYSHLRKTGALENEYTDWAWNNLHKSKDDFIYEDGGRYVVPYDARSWIKEISTETLVVTGGKDNLVPEETSQEVIKDLENVKEIIFNNASHSIPWTHDEQLINELEKFFKK
tara:strand:+ start:1078 stop:1998 length:921 start_codon:yes stop_codon:yes gene_type:complete